MNTETGALERGLSLASLLARGFLSTLSAGATWGAASVAAGEGARVSTASVASPAVRSRAAGRGAAAPVALFGATLPIDAGAPAPVAPVVTIAAGVAPGALGG